MKNKANGRDWNPKEHYKNVAVAKEYDRIRFSSLSGRIFNYLEKRVIEICFQDLPRGTLVLDLPCGTGRLAEVLLDSGLRVHGADISAEMLEVAKERLSHHGDRLDTEIMDAFKLTGNDRQFEAALCARVLMHFPLDEQIAFLRGIASVVRKRIVINHSLNSPYQRFRRWIKKILGHPKSVNFPVTNEEIKQLLSEAGFVEIKRKRLNSLISEAVYIVAERID
ncbi:class I SAM-dependent methyltransferase [Nitrosomonas sp.]|uniref:class I SAM-dependent methyltransferase n=1 Tax=Nitrosomonas sp. TaxID=42353 RepID=UPI0026256F99|nr:class I SAM-dependent methyltransferase [Nitrosomonas sp.]MCW5602805.1 class I SAM-dependent methyltransferase [Nitrosomonas sp.]